ncbi:hypothetical protein OSZ70_33105 [Rhizobium leguminosarum]|nr:hypothetical protein [Rhizobium leguminosarum]MDI5929020.1 hypothetical protein [Rhizobium leguminosarum]
MARFERISWADDFKVQMRAKCLASHAYMTDDLAGGYRIAFFEGQILLHMCVKRVYRLTIECVGYRHQVPEGAQRLIPKDGASGSGPDGSADWRPKVSAWMKIVCAI